MRRVITAAVACLGFLIVLRLRVLSLIHLYLNHLLLLQQYLPLRNSKYVSLFGWYIVTLRCMQFPVLCRLYPHPTCPPIPWCLVDATGTIAGVGLWNVTHLEKAFTGAKLH